MYPFVIVWKSKDLIDNDFKNYFGHMNQINDISEKLDDFIIELIELYEYKIKNSLYYGDLCWNKFCEIVNNKPYDDSIFFDIKYFDVIDKKWHDYDVNNIGIDLDKNFINLINKLFNHEISLDVNTTNKIDKIDNDVLDQKNIKQILTLDL